MTIPDNVWRKLSDEILQLLSKTPAEKRLSVFKEKLSSLPPELSPAVEHFVTVALTLHQFDQDTKISMSTSSNNRLIMILAFALSALISASGLYLVTLSGDNAISKINIAGINIETQSVGVACLVLSFLLFYLLGRKALK
ncbi:hypothetical protein KQ944_12490 [Bacillus subtilis]|uniref:hypothetical protein n=1 Tax=Pseudochrobactrum asaccharolyticum TaxID=354351 RepID=UPI001F30492C|nr:hypothetical protein [Pseudochrobactrum asaccharolyticum]MCF7645984.1 hypothetical protein [Pseudochrobactrum asaccharolyticum]MCF7672451.1 hypothetical protein [Bacillus subtilis]